MYEEHFGFIASPFSIAPDPHYLYMSERHKEALAHLLYGIKSNGGFVLLTGEVGTGKTTICRCLLEQVPDGTDIAFILNPKLTVEELLGTICDEFGIHYPANRKSIKFFIDQINSFLINSHAKERKAVLIIDEAQNLNIDVLEQLRLLTNLETNERKLLQIILLGQPELRNMLSRPALRQLAQRITARYHLDSLSEKEVGGYVAHRLSVAGGRGNIFPSSTIKSLFKLSGGTPRLINIICDRALLGAYVLERDQVSQAILKKAAHEVFGESAEVNRHHRKISGWAIAAGLLISGSVLATAYYSHRPDMQVAVVLETMEPATQNVQSEQMEHGDQSKPANQKETPSTSPDITVQQEIDDNVISANDSNEEFPETFPLQWPSDIPLTVSREMAFQALLDLWDIPSAPNQTLPVCQAAELYNLRCLQQKGGLEELLDFNRPAVLTLYSEKGEQFFAALTAYHGQTATFVIGSAKKRVATDDIGLRWRGEYVLLWAKPGGYVSAITPENRTGNADWLDKKLASVQGRPPSPEDRVTYDDAMANQVKQFQFSRNLVPDGIVGPQTIIHLNSACGNSVPMLIQRQTDQ